MVISNDWMNTNNGWKSKKQFNLFYIDKKEPFSLKVVQRKRLSYVTVLLFHMKQKAVDRECGCSDSSGIRRVWLDNQFLFRRKGK